MGSRVPTEDAHAFGVAVQLDNRICEGRGQSAVRDLPDHDTAVLGAAGNDVVIVRTELDVQDRPCVAAHGGVGHVDTSRLAQGQHHEGSSTTGVHNHGHKFWVDGAEVAVPRHLGDSDVIVALVGFRSLTKDVTELTGPHNLPGHGERHKADDTAETHDRGKPKKEEAKAFTTASSSLSVTATLPLLFL